MHSNVNAAAPPLWPCPRCQAFIPSTSKVCPNCGHQLTASHATRNVAIIGAVVVLVVAVAVAYLFNHAASVFPINATTGGARDSITQSGTGTMQSAPFTLHGGTYAAAWQATPSSASSGCYLGLDLYRSDGVRAGTIASLVLSSGAAQRGSSFLNGLPAGTYYVDALTECSWIVGLAN